MRKKSFLDELEQQPGCGNIRFQLLIGAAFTAAMMLLLLFVGWIEQFFY